MRVVVVSHAHPAFSKGGGELAAYYLWQGLNQLPGCEAWFIGRGQPEVMGDEVDILQMSPHDYLISGNASSHDLHATTNLGPNAGLAKLLMRIQPDVIHFHHYVSIGIESFRLAKRLCPSARIVLTLHEFLAICSRDGQMLKTDNRLCHQYSPAACHLCFPQIPKNDIFLREQYIKSFFRLVDEFISPSEFLRERYIDWGIDPRQIAVIENGLPAGERIPPRRPRPGEARGRLAYFGQINPYKGIDVILESLMHLPKEVRRQVTLDVFGSGLDRQPPDVQARIRALADRCGDRVHFHGAYEPEELGRLMAEVDWVVMGSIWWENSPLVIQEAYKYGRPVICPDIGGMAEKAKRGHGGLNFRARDSVSLAALIQEIIEQPGIFDELISALPKSAVIADIVGQHMRLYRSSSDEQLGS